MSSDLFGLKKSSKSVTPRRVRTTSWADGLRGLAAIFVVSSHLTLCFARWIVPPSFGKSGEIALFQRPFFRLVAQGQAFVAIFFVLLGFVNTLKAVQLARAGATSEALSSLATSTFRRTGRLVFPAAAVTVIAWFACQLGAFQLARRTDAYWLKLTSPAPNVGWDVAVGDLLRQLLSTWAYGVNAYDQPQWALVYLFKGSLYVFITLLATVNTTPRFRLVAEVVLYIWSWAVGDGLVGLNIFAGMILAELSFMLPSKPPSYFLRILPYPLVVLGLYLGSFPSEYYDQVPWSAQLGAIGTAIFPTGADMGRYWAAIGAQMVCLGVSLSPTLRTMFSSRALLWLGGLSYPLYLLHGPLMRSIMTYMLYLPAGFAFQPKLQDDGTPDPESYIPTPGVFRLCVTLPVFFVILLALVKIWAVKVEPRLGAATDAFESFSRSWGWATTMTGPATTNGSFVGGSAVKETEGRNLHGDSPV